MSMPRAAMSVATSTCSVSSLNSASAARARRLALVAVDRERADAVLAELLGEPVRAVLRAREHEHLDQLFCLIRCVSSSRFLSRSTGMDLLRDRFGRRVAARDFDQRRRVEQVVGERLDLVRERRREQQVLALRRQHRQHALDVVDEAHVEHAVGFVEHEDFELRQVDGLLLHVVEQAAGRRDEDVDAALSASICGLMPTPPNITVDFSFMYLP